MNIEEFVKEASNVKGIGKVAQQRLEDYFLNKEKIKQERDTELIVDELETNTIHCGDNIKVMRERMPNESIDLTVTSPPYDNLRDYECDWDFDFKALAKELHRVTKDGGVVVWVVGDQTIDGSETGSSFKQALYFKKIGFKLHDTMIYKTNKLPISANRYEPCFEYMFVLSKGTPKTFNPIKIKSKYAGEDTSAKTFRHTGKDTSKLHSGNKVKDYKVKNNAWFYPTGHNKTTKDNFAFEHPAMFPEQLAEDHIKTWSNECDVVFDPMCGGGTTLKMAKKLNRKYVGIDVSDKYCDISKKRVDTLKEER